VNETVTNLTDAVQSRVSPSPSTEQAGQEPHMIKDILMAQQRAKQARMSEPGEPGPGNPPRSGLAPPLTEAANPNYRPRVESEERLAETSNLKSSETNTQVDEVQQGQRASSQAANLVLPVPPGLTLGSNGPPAEGVPVTAALNPTTGKATPVVGEGLERWRAVRNPSRDPSTARDVRNTSQGATSPAASTRSQSRDATPAMGLNSRASSVNNFPTLQEQRTISMSPSAKLKPDPTPSSSGKPQEFHVSSAQVDNRRWSRERPNGESLCLTVNTEARVARTGPNADISLTIDPQRIEAIVMEYLPDDSTAVDIALRHSPDGRTQGSQKLKLKFELWRRTDKDTPVKAKVQARHFAQWAKAVNSGIRLVWPKEK